MGKKKTNNFELKKVSINNIQEFTDFKYIDISGLKLKSDKCVLYDNCGIGIYLNRECIAFIECKNFDVTNFGNFHTAIKYNCHKGEFSSSYIYLKNKEFGEDRDDEEKSVFITDKFKVGDKVIRRYNEDHAPKDDATEKYSDSYLILNAYLHNENAVLENIDSIRDDFEWELIEIVDELMGRIQKNGVEELCLLKDIEKLDTIIHNNEEILKELKRRRNGKK